MLYPCKGCESRFVGCHATCQKYIEIKEAHEKELERIRHLANIQNDADDFHLTAVRKTRKRLNRRW